MEISIGGKFIHNERQPPWKSTAMEKEDSWNSVYSVKLVAKISLLQSPTLDFNYPSQTHQASEMVPVLGTSFSAQACISFGWGVDHVYQGGE